jgi:SAM-dependent methyltransferase
MKNRFFINQSTQDNQIYKNQNVFGSEPNKLLQEICSQLPTGSEFLDLGCGQGRDALFMLQQGFKITAVDNSPEGIKTIREFIQTNNLPLSSINLFCQDIEIFYIEKDKYSIINAFNSLQFLPKKKALRLIDNIKYKIKNQGYIVISGFTIDDSLYNKTINDSRCFFETQELKKLFSDFNIILYEEKIIKDKGHAGRPESHTHGVVEIIVKK